MGPSLEKWTTRTFRQLGADAEIKCIHCPYTMIVAFHTLELMFKDRDVPLIDMCIRLRCTRCGRRGAQMAAWERKRR